MKKHLTVLFTLFLLSASLYAKDCGNKYFNVTSEAEVLVQPDSAKLTFGISMRTKTLEEGKNKMKKILDKAYAFCGKKGIKRKYIQLNNINITAIGTNAVATASMLKAGAKNAATGENPVVVACRKADVIIGPVGIVIADSLLGEITEKMAVAVGKSNAARILIPMNKCDNLIAGVPDLNTGALIADAVSKLRFIAQSRKV